MPQITLEYTPGTLSADDLPGLMGRVHAILATEAGIAVTSCKSRWREVGGFVIGDGEPGQGFVHLEVHLFDGRPTELRQRIGEKCLQALKQLASPAPGLQITVEIGEMCRATYFKHPAAVHQ
jgi:5-carboxymethyl-2-hydroxymuconate isomerase